MINKKLILWIIFTQMYDIVRKLYRKGGILVINRRYFLAFCGVSGSSLLLAKPTMTQTPIPPKSLRIIAKVQQHMFPPQSELPSAERFRAIEYFSEAVAHPSYDKDLRQLIIKGAKKLQEREKDFVAYNEDQREKALRAYEQSTLGRRWLNRILIVTMEALLGDPIYGGNYQSLGWQSLGTSGGEPRPLTRYVEL